MGEASEQVGPAPRGGCAGSRRSPTRRLEVLVVDDEPNICELLCEAITQRGDAVSVCTDAERAVAAAGDRAFDVVILDINMPGMTGVEALERLRGQLPRAVFVMITGDVGSPMVEDALAAGAFICLSKPLRIAEVNELLEGIAEYEEVASASERHP